MSSRRPECVVLAKVGCASFHRLAVRAGSLLMSVAAVFVLVLSTPSAIAQRRPEFVIAVLGDSYASGEGSPDVHGKHSMLGDLLALECFGPDLTPICHSEKWWSPDSWFDNRRAVFPQQDDPGWQDEARRCHRSSKGPATHAAMLIAARFADIKITVLNFACSGAEIKRGLLLGWPGTEPKLGAAPLSSQVAALEAYAKKTSLSVDAIVMNIGGNDARFGDIIVDCVVSQLIDSDCSDNQLVKEVGELVRTDNDDSPLLISNARAPLSVRYRVVDAILRGGAVRIGPWEVVLGLKHAKPAEVYLTGTANPSHAAASNDGSLPANPENLCDGTQSLDRDYKNLSLAESYVIENLVGGPENSMNAAMKQAADLYRWNFIDTFGITRNHGVCANSHSFFRTNTDALRIQGDEGLGISKLSGIVFSPGFAHQNEAGYAARASLIANVVAEQVRMQFQAPILFLDQIEVATAQAGTVKVGTEAKVTFRWDDPSPLGPPETYWQLRIVKPIEATNSSGPKSEKKVISNGPPRSNGDFTKSAVGKAFTWRIAESGEFTAQVRGCRMTPTKRYCGPYSEAVTVVTLVPGTPVGLKPVRESLDEWKGTTIKVTWTPGPRTPSSVWYEVANGPYGSRPCPPSFPPNANCGFGMVSPTIESTASTTLVRESHAPSKHVFQVRACTTAGCSPYTPELVTEKIQVQLPARQGQDIGRRNSAP